MVEISNLGIKHKSGILMPVFSLPSNYGIGGFGKECYEFIDFLARCKQTVWQVLPLNPTSFGDSPYQSPASFAGNPYFISIDDLKSQGLLTNNEVKEARYKSERIDYGWLFNNRYLTLRKAFSRFEETKEYKKFIKDNDYWVSDYALFMALKVKNSFRPWNEWNDDEKFYEKAVVKKEELANEIKFWEFLQYEFYNEWTAIKKYAKERKINILGDMPIYVAYDSVDVWSNPTMFKLDERLNPVLVAGVPPDGFSADGQLWGNPIYNWDLMKEDGFKWWIQRINHSKKLYDILRIDHFRGFSSYYVVPFGDETAKNGRWEPGCGIELFEAIKKNVKNIKVIAEDLGVITDDVRELLDKTGFPGMKVLQFAFGCPDSEYLPRLYKNSNCIVYTGTHDNQTSKQWIKDLNDYERKLFNKECKHKKGNKRLDDFINMALSSIADLAIIPLQDYLGIDGKGRINMPSTSTGNWQWKLKSNNYLFMCDVIKNKIISTHR